MNGEIFVCLWTKRTKVAVGPARLGVCSTVFFSSFIMSLVVFPPQRSKIENQQNKPADSMPWSDPLLWSKAGLNTCEATWSNTREFPGLMSNCVNSDGTSALILLVQQLYWTGEKEVKLCSAGPVKPPHTSILFHQRSTLLRLRCLALAKQKSTTGVAVATEINLPKLFLSNKEKKHNHEHHLNLLWISLLAHSLYYFCWLFFFIYVFFSPPSAF